ncbi:DHA2 family efflux MFS transporter permease subunit [Nocardia bovistercoris]|nr:DHA2 family efflux MFS transporter permease subunit [Nocardia bovistercoris]
MVIIGATIVNVALSRIERDLEFGAANLAWVQSAYSLAFGGLLLLGGRSGDVFGRRRLFVAGLAVFTLASLLAGAATSPGLLIAARVVQGAGAAFAAPASLSLLAATFPDGPRRHRALGVFSMIAGLGLTLGLILGGALTTLSWRWVFLVNIPVGVAAITLARVYLPETPRHRARFDVAGAVSSALGVAVLVYGFLRAAAHGWSDPITIGCFVAGVAMLVLFVTVQMRAAQPVMPPRLFAQRARACAYADMLLLAAAMGSIMFFLSLYVQVVLGYGPLRAGLAFLPMALAQFVCARSAPRLVPRLGAAPLTITGCLVTLAAGGWLTRLGHVQGYPGAVLGPLILLGVGVGFAFMPLNMVILAGLPASDTGSASGVLQCAQQLGLALGIAVATTVYGGALDHHGRDHAIATAMIAVTAMLAAATLVAVSTLRTRTSTPAR